MLIHSLTLENVKSYTRTKVEFSPGTNAIVGHNGSGKTTILEAIGYALFDHLPYSQADFVREGQRSASVTVEFLSDYDERAYQVMRSCGSGRTHTVIDPELDIRICEGKADVMQFLRLHLGIGPDAEPGDLFRNAVGVPQGSFTVSFLATASARKAVFDPLLKVAEYRRAWERMREPLSLLRERVGDQAVEISRLEGELIRLPAVQAEADALTGRIRNADTELRAARTELTAAESVRQTMEAKRERLLELQSMVQMEQQVVAEQERTLAAARQRLTESKEAVTTTEANRAGHDAYRAAQQDQRAVNERMVQRRRLQDERANVHTRLTQAAAQEDARKRALADIAEAEKTAADLADAAAEQERLDLEVRDTQRQVDRLKESTARVQREHAAVDRAQHRLERMRAEVARAQELEASREQLQTRVGILAAGDYGGKDQGYPIVRGNEDDRRARRSAKESGNSRGLPYLRTTAIRGGSSAASHSTPPALEGNGWERPRHPPRQSGKPRRNGNRPAPDSPSRSRHCVPFPASMRSTRLKRN